MIGTIRAGTKSWTGLRDSGIDSQGTISYTEWKILMAAFANSAAGADTTHMSINGILYFLIKNPTSMSKLRQEIEAMSKEGTIPDAIKFNEAQKCRIYKLSSRRARGYTLPPVCHYGGSSPNPV
jgi:cytochrome P450